LRLICLLVGIAFRVGDAQSEEAHSIFSVPYPLRQRKPHFVRRESWCGTSLVGSYPIPPIPGPTGPLNKPDYRFTNARQLMAYLGLVPSEHSSGSTVRRAGITKAGNALARRVLIEGAWNLSHVGPRESETSRSP
jgi:hypothetical protein